MLSPALQVLLTIQIALGLFDVRYPAPGDPARQRVVHDFHRLQLAQQTVGAGGEAADAAVGLVAPVIEAAALSDHLALSIELEVPRDALRAA